VEYVGGVHDRVGRNEALATVLSEPLRFVPSTEYGYSNGAYTLLAMIVEEVSGLPFADYMHREVFAPAGMSHTFLLSEPVPNGLSAAHGYDDGEDNDDFSAWSGSPWAHWGSGGVFSNLRDMARWERALNEDVVLSTASLDLLFTPYVQARQEYYAYGWRVGSTDYAGHLVYHYGSEAIGMGAAYMRFTDSGTTIIVLSNRVADEVDFATHTAVAIAHKLLEPGYDGMPRYAR
jgi:CubicO group peptidase (beta-lactamase class C family)